MLVSSHLTPSSVWCTFRIPSSAEQKLKGNKAVVFIHLDSSTGKNGLQESKLFLFNIAFFKIYFSISIMTRVQLRLDSFGTPSNWPAACLGLWICFYSYCWTWYSPWNFNRQTWKRSSTFRLYLTECHLFVCINEDSLEPKKSGIPQGSAFGPLLFWLQLNFLGIYFTNMM